MSASDHSMLLDDVVYPDTSLLITQDGKPVDNLFVEKQNRLLTEPLWSSWTAPEGRPFRVLANVGLFFAYKEPPLVPDVMFAIDVASPREPRESDNRSYFMWMVGKPPDVVIEIVSDNRGREDSEKLRAYERIRIPYYVIFDPELVLDGGVLRTFALHPEKYREIDPTIFAKIGLGLTLWDGIYEDSTDTWLRWIDSAGNLVPTGKERADQEKERADQEKAAAEQEKANTQSERIRADQAEERAQRLEARLRAAGISANGAP